MGSMIQFMKSVLSHCVVAAFAIIPLVSQTPRLEISAQTTSLVPFEPILLHLSLINSESDGDCLIPGRWSSFVKLEARLENSDAFFPLNIWWYPKVSRPPMPPETLKQGNIVSAELGYYPFNGQGNLVFSKGEKYILRAALMMPEGGVQLLSNLLSISIIEPSAVDADAIVELQANRQLRFYLLPEQIAYDMTAAEKSAAEFKIKHGKSIFNKYIQATISLKNKKGVDARLLQFGKMIKETP